MVYKDIEIEISFTGGTSQVGDERLRSRWWDQIIRETILNSKSIPEINYNAHIPAATDAPDYEYLIISPDDADFLAWADTIKQFRTLQGIFTGIVTTTDIGGNTVSAIETYVDNAYNTWAVPPSAILLLGDYGTGSSGIISQFFTYPAGYPDFVSDNQFADVDGDNLPDIAFARITANDAAQLEVMITKFLDYERNPPTSADFYDHPITALGWQTERWFQICSEVVGGYLKNVQGKNPVRINAVYSGNPNSDAWSTATNTSTVINYFGPYGLGSIPATPQELGGFSGGTATDVINAINSGSYMLQHRDHGMYTGWGEPSFTSTSINSLNNVNNKLPFIFSINCQTGAFHRSTESFAEKFHRHTYNGQNSGALGLIAATEVSYSFVNDVYVWGMFDNMHPDFMPGYSTTFPVNYVMPAFGNVAGKHFLYQSSWPYNTSDKLITYRLFHHHGDAFMTLYTEVPQNLSVSHNSVLQAGQTTYTVTADAGSLIALTVNSVILATTDGTGSAVDINIPAQNPGDVMIVTVTKQNYFRYSSAVDVVSNGLFAQFSGSPTDLCLGETVSFTDQSFGSPTSWTWSFPGGTPTSWSGQNPPVIVYNAADTYDVSLTVGDGTSTDSETKTEYITVAGITSDFSGTPATLVIGNSVTYTDMTTCSPTSWRNTINFFCSESCDYLQHAGRIFSYACG
nr:PKD domain-containing protein [Bacteroidota bacterium]